jgi:hypothetical protein
MWALVKDCVAARNGSVDVNGVMEIAGEKFNCLSQYEWAAQCMHVNKTEEEEYLKLELLFGEISEDFIVNPQDIYYLKHNPTTITYVGTKSEIRSRLTPV